MRKTIKFLFFTAILATFVSFAWGFAIHTYTLFTLTSPTIEGDK